ncbi:MAG: hypothetical protein CML56_04580 [Rhodobacteraceae bacterium]|nr:hypothetical protein [Paracoccaceae bacterium]
MYTGKNLQQGDKNEVGIITRIETNVAGQKVYIVECIDPNLWTDHARHSPIEKRWAATNCEVVNETR